jgi:hypothetical protein
MSEEYQQEISRRGVLKALGVAGITSLAGCGGGGSDPGYGQIEPDDGEYEDVSIPEIRSGELEPYYHVSFEADVNYIGRGNVSFGYHNSMNKLAEEDEGVDGARYQLTDPDGNPVIDAFLPDELAQEAPDDGFFRVKGFLTEEQGPIDTNVHDGKHAGDPLFVINELEPTERNE